jgi:NAD(P)-dependent dehydrogenase (short-subunit alcohol dehydrogenase family)
MQADAGQAGGAPSMVERGQGGSIVLTSSIAGSIAFPDLAHCTAAEHGVTGLMRTLAVARAPHRIRVDSVHPTTVRHADGGQRAGPRPLHGASRAGQAIR